MLTGQVPDAEQVRALDTYLNTVIDHGLNASTFAARVIAATLSASALSQRVTSRETSASHTANRPSELSSHAPRSP